MRRIIFCGVILTLILLINSCVTTPNNNGGSTNDFEQYIELVFGNSGFEEYTYYNKNRKIKQQIKNRHNDGFCMKGTLFNHFFFVYYTILDIFFQYLLHKPKYQKNFCN